MALEEDLGSGDLTSQGLVAVAAQGVGRLIAKQDGILAGQDVFTCAFHSRDAEMTIRWKKNDGEALCKGEQVARLQGSGRALLEAERTALNFLQRMSGTATLTRSFVRAVQETPGARILDTRKTTPGLRLLERYAVRCGGGENHRFGLFDEAMIKENHVALAGKPLSEALCALRASVGSKTRICCEAETEEQARAAIQGGADVVLLDNFSPGDLREICPRLRVFAQESGRRVEFESSGGITLQTAAAFAASGVDRLSVGALTHSAPALDLSLLLEPLV
jgi:nicotinate-nucleotide pyrophosphorylase (carboxylating)